MPAIAVGFCDIPSLTKHLSQFGWAQPTPRKVEARKMALGMVLNTAERERLGVLVNNLSFYASQIMIQRSPELTKRALANLDKIKNDDEALLRRLDEVAREQSDESPLRVIEDVVRLPTDIAQMLTFVRRCLLVSAFLGHCLAQSAHATITTDARSSEKRLH